METNYQNVKEKELSEVENMISFQKLKIISDFNFLLKAVETHPNLSEWSNLSSTDKINEDIGGISEFDEISKREAAKFLISNFGFQSFGITLSNGEMYFLEPFEHQSNLSKLNFSDREWFQGVLTTKSTYVSDVFISAASNHPIIVISTPVFSNEGELIGMWGGSLDLEYLTSFFNEVKMKNTSILLIDENNIIISDTEDVDSHRIIKEESFNNSSPENEKNITYIQDKENHIFIDY
jgi:hypothetical protein